MTRPSPWASDAGRPAATVRVALWSARHRVLVLVGWIAVMLGLFGASAAIGTRTQTALSTGDARTESELGAEAFQDAGQWDPGEPAWFVVSALDGSLTEGPPREALASVVSAPRSATLVLPGGTGPVPLLSDVVDPATAPLLMGLVSGDGASALIPARFPGDSVQVDARIAPVRALLDELRATHPQVRILVLDTSIVNQEVGELVTQDLDGSLRLTLPITFLILVLAFGALLAAVVPLDMTDMFAGQTPKVIGFVLTLSFVLLLVVFRSLVIPILAIVLTLLSAGAAFGIMQLVFGEGWFGLAMDYQVFILTRIKEERDRGLATVDAVTRGILATSGPVTSAAAIMVAVFAVMASLHFVIIKQMGLGLAIAVLVDATIVRTLLLPSMLKLLGDRSWWLPSWLGWLPRITIEGEPLDGAGSEGPVGALTPAGGPIAR